MLTSILFVHFLFFYSTSLFLLRVDMNVYVKGKQIDAWESPHLFSFSLSPSLSVSLYELASFARNKNKHHHQSFAAAAVVVCVVSVYVSIILV